MTEKKDRLCELAEPYALGALGVDEAEAFDAHLHHCAACAELVRNYRSVTNLLPLGVEPMEPPVGMKARVLANVLASGEAKAGRAEEPMAVVPQGKTGAEQADEAVATAPLGKAEGECAEEPAARPGTQARRGRLWPYVSAGLAAAVLALGVYSVQLRDNVSRLERQLAAGTEPAQVNQAVALSPAAQNIVAKGLATIVVDSRGTHLVVQAEKLPELKGTEAYQVWLIKGETTYSAGTFLSREGNGALYYSFEPRDYDTVAITLEPDAAGKTPRGMIVLAAPIKRG